MPGRELWTRTTAKERDAFDLGAQSKRGGTYIGKGKEWYRKDEANLTAWFERGYRLQQNFPGQQVRFSTHNPFLNDEKQAKVEPVEPIDHNEETDMKTRTTDEIEALKADYRTSTYDAYAAEQVSAGFEPQPFDEAFAAHLAALDDAEAPAETETAAEKRKRESAEKKAAADAAKAEKKAAADALKQKKLDDAAAAKAEKKAAADAAKAAKAAEQPAKEPKAKKFRPTSEDRVTVMTAAKALVGDETPRLKLAGGATYDDFLKGTQMDVEGNASVVFDVFTAKAIRTDGAAPVGKLVATIEGGKLAKVAKA